MCGSFGGIKCAEIIVAHLGYLNYTQYTVRVGFEHLKLPIKGMNFTSLAITNVLSVPVDLPAWVFHINGITQHVVFGDWLLSLSVMSQGSSGDVTPLHPSGSKFPSCSCPGDLAAGTSVANAEGAVAGIAGVHHHAQLMFVYLVGMRFHHIGQAGFELLTSVMLLHTHQNGRNKTEYAEAGKDVGQADVGLPAGEHRWGLAVLPRLELLGLSNPPTSASQSVGVPGCCDASLTLSVSVVVHSEDVRKPLFSAREPVSSWRPLTGSDITYAYSEDKVVLSRCGWVGGWMDGQAGRQVHGRFYRGGVAQGRRRGFNGQAGLELVTSSDPPASAPQSADIIGVNHHTRPSVNF
ncbi:Transmembrane protein 181 [Plecturocebus cupreus]